VAKIGFGLLSLRSLSLSLSLSLCVPRFEHFRLRQSSMSVVIAFVSAFVRACGIDLDCFVFVCPSFDLDLSPFATGRSKFEWAWPSIEAFDFGRVSLFPIKVMNWENVTSSFSSLAGELLLFSMSFY